MSSTVCFEDVIKNKAFNEVLKVCINWLFR